jgi:hypothetical protein
MNALLALSSNDAPRRAPIVPAVVPAPAPAPAAPPPVLAETPPLPPPEAPVRDAAAVERQPNRLDSGERKRIKASVKSDDDARLVVRLLETRMEQCRSEAAKRFEYLVDTRHASYIELRLVSLRAGIFSDANASQMRALSSRVRGIDVHPERRELRVRVARAGRAGKSAPVRAAFVPLEPGKRKRRFADINFDAGRVHTADDRENITRIYDEVINVARITPDIAFWYEHLGCTVGRGDSSVSYSATQTDDGSESHRSASLGGRGGGGGYDDVEDDDDDTASIEDVSLCEHALGYALCFSNMPTFNACFFEYLRGLFGGIITRMYVAWGAGDPPAPVLVIRIRAARTSTARAAYLMGASEPRGNPLTFGDRVGGKRRNGLAAHATDGSRAPLKKKKRRR